MSKKILAACVALVAFAAFALPAVASASPVLTDDEGNVVEAGATITALSINLVLADGSGGGIQCTESHLHGVLTKNPGTNIEADITVATFKGNSEKECGVEGIFGVSSALVTTGESLPWCIESTGEDSWKLRGGTCGEEPRNVSFTVHLTTILGTVSCEYATAEVNGSVTTESEEDLDFSEQEFAGAEGNPGACPASETLSGSFALKDAETETETVIS